MPHGGVAVPGDGQGHLDGSLGTKGVTLGHGLPLRAHPPPAMLIPSCRPPPNPPTRVLGGNLGRGVRTSPPAPFLPAGGTTHSATRSRPGSTGGAGLMGMDGPPPIQPHPKDACTELTHVRVQLIKGVVGEVRGGRAPSHSWGLPTRYSYTRRSWSDAGHRPSDSPMGPGLGRQGPPVR